MNPEDKPAQKTDASHEATVASGAQQESAETPSGLQETAGSPDRSLETIGRPRGSQETTNNTSGPQETIDMPQEPPETGDSSERHQGNADTPRASEEATSAAGPQEIINKPQEPLESADLPDSQQDTTDTPLPSEEETNGFDGPQETIDVPQEPPEYTDSPDRTQVPEETPLTSQEITGVPELNQDIPATFAVAVQKTEVMPVTNSERNRRVEQKSETKRLSIDKIHRFSFQLTALREKQYVLVKKLKIMETARPKFDFADLEVKSDLSVRKPEKELLLYLYSENRRMEEKCFYAKIESKKCEEMTTFYSNYRYMAYDVLEVIASMTHNSEAEAYLCALKDDLIKMLKVAQMELEKHQKTMVVKNKEFQKLEMEMMKSAQANATPQQLRAKLQKGTALTDDEILQLTLDRCRDTNDKLKTSIQTSGLQIDNLREQYLWKRDVFVTKLSDFDQTQLETVPEAIKECEGSNPPTPTGSMFDIILDKEMMVNRMASIAKNTEDLIKFHYKLKDLKARVIASSGFEEPRSCTEGSLMTVLSGTHPPRNVIFQNKV